MDTRGLCRQKGDALPRPPPSRSRGALHDQGSALFHRLGLRPFGALSDLKLNLVAFSERPEPRRVNRRVVDEDIRPIVLRDEPKPFLVVKPLHRSLSHGMILLAWGERKCRHACSEAHKKTAHGLSLAVAVP